MDVKKTISSITVQGKKDSEGRDFRTQLNIALYEVCSQAGFDVQKDADKFLLLRELHPHQRKRRS